MTARAKRKKNTAYSTHEYQLTKVTPTGGQAELITVIGSRDAFHNRLKAKLKVSKSSVLDITTETEEYRSHGLTDFASE